MPEGTVTAKYQKNVNGADIYQLYIRDSQGESQKAGSGFDETMRATCRELEQGDKIRYSVTTDKSGKYNNFVSLEKMQGAPKSNGGGTEDRQDAIMRQSAMGYASHIVASTLTSKSDLDKAAMEVVRLAEQYFVPFAKGERGTVEDLAAEQDNTNRQNDQDFEGPPF